jgi:putative multiple sugar transport system permease protein
MFLAYRLAGFFGLSEALVLIGALIGVYVFITVRTVTGRRIYAVGGNVKAAMLSGVKTKRMVFLVFINMGVLSAVGGLIAAACFKSASASSAFWVAVRR